MQNSEFRMKRSENDANFFILYSEFCILNSFAKQVEVQVPARDDDRDWSFRLDLSREQSRKTQCPRRLDDHLRAVHRELDRIEQHVVIDADDVLYAFADDGEVALTNRERARAVCDRVRRIDRYDATAAKGLLAVIPRGGLDAVDHGARLR